jgi:hypothetical protein
MLGEGYYKVIEKCRRCEAGRQIVYYLDKHPIAWGKPDGECGRPGDEKCGEKIGGSMISAEKMDRCDAQDEIHGY